MAFLPRAHLMVPRVEGRLDGDDELGDDWQDFAAPRLQHVLHALQAGAQAALGTQSGCRSIWPRHRPLLAHAEATAADGLGTGCPRHTSRLPQEIAFGTAGTTLVNFAAEAAALCVRQHRCWPPRCETEFCRDSDICVHNAGAAVGPCSCRPRGRTAQKAQTGLLGSDILLRCNCLLRLDGPSRADESVPGGMRAGSCCG